MTTRKRASSRRRWNRRSRIGAAVGSVAVVAAVGLQLPSWAASDPTPLSQGKQVTASSVEGAGLEPKLAVDGAANTRWSSTFSDPQWLRVDLGAVRMINRVKLSWETAYASGYRIETSTDGNTWTTLYSTNQGDGGVDDLTGLSGSGQYVRMYGTKRATQWGYSLYEFQVFGADASTAPTSPTPTTTPTNSTSKDLTDSHKKDIAMQLVSSAENSSLDWKAQYSYIQDIGDGRGYTAGIIGFTTGTGDLLDLVELYTQRVPGNVLAKYLPALRSVNGSASHSGLGNAFVADWKTAAGTASFQQAQNDLRDSMYFNPAVNQAKADGLRALGQFIYYDAIVMHGPGDDGVSFGGIRKAALAKAKPPAQGGNETTYLNAFLDARKAAMLTEEAHTDTDRVDTEQRVFLKAGNLDLNPPLHWTVYGDSYSINS